MRSLKIVAMVLLIALASMACAILSPDGEATPTAEATTPASESAAYPSIGSAYPPLAYPALEGGSPMALPPGEMIYPDLNDGDSIEWVQVPGLLNFGLVTKVVQTHDLLVYFTLQDGRTLQAVEPEIDEIVRQIEACGEMCKDIRFATE